MNDEPSGRGLDVTLREFVSGQTLFGRYTLIRVLGRGGMGVVWLARDEKLGRDVALKFLPELIVHDHAVLDDLKRETNRSLELTHKNIVRIHDFIYDDKSACISMEFIDGETLSSLRVQKEHKIFEPDEIAEWISQVCDALDYAHNQALIVHRDVKPANLMINKRGYLKVADFGVARSLADSVSRLTKEPRGTSGTLVYMSPQQLDGERGSHLDDVYSLGATIYELLTSKPPFYSGNIDHQIRERIPPPMMQRRKDLAIEGRVIPKTWEEVVSSCLTKDPARRPQSATELARLLTCSVPKVRRTPTSLAKPSKKMALAMAVAAFCFVGIAGWYFLGHRPPTARAISETTASKQTAPQSSALSNSEQEHSVAYVAGSPSVRLNTTPTGATVTLGGLEEQLTPATISASPGKYSLYVELDGYKPFVRQVEVREKQLTDLGTINLKPNNGAVELTTTPPGAKVFQNGDQVGVTPFTRQEMPSGKITFIIIADGYLPRATDVTIKPGETFKSTIPLEQADETYHGTIADMPVVIKFEVDRKSGKISRNGEVIAKFSGSWSGSLLHATIEKSGTQESNVVGIGEFFTMRISEDGKVAGIQLHDGQKTLRGTLASLRQPPESVLPAGWASATKSAIASVYKGTITGGTALTVSFGGDRKSGTITERSKSGDVVVKFSGVWEDAVLHAVTGDVISQPPGVRWEPEAFTLRFAEDGRSGSYEINEGGRFYTAQLSPTDTSVTTAMPLIHAPELKLNVPPQTENNVIAKSPQTATQLPSETPAEHKRAKEGRTTDTDGAAGVKVNTSPVGATVTLGGMGTKQTPATFNANKGKYSLFVELDGYEPIAREVEAKEGQLIDLGTITLQRSKSKIDLSSAPQGAKIFQGDTSLGVTPFRRDDFPSGRTRFLLVSEGYLPREFTAELNSKELFKVTVPLAKPLPVYKGMIGGERPITITVGADLKSGTMTQGSTLGELVVKFAGIWTGSTLRAVTHEVLSKPEGILWESESFTLRFSDDGKTAAYDCNYGTENFTTSLVAP